LECADRLEGEAQAIGIMRSLDATRASQWLHELAGAIREAAAEPAPGERADPA
jgi:hypothetical protein